MSSSRKITIGVFLIGTVLLFTVGLFLIGDRRQLFSESIHVSAEFKKLSGLKNGSKVMVSGMEAGEVTAIRVPTSPEGKFRVTFRMIKKLQPVLRTDSVASIQTEGLVGSKILQVEAGTEQGRKVKDGSTIHSVEPVEIGDVIKEASETVKETKGAVIEIKGQVTDVIHTISDLNQQAGDLIKDAGGDVKNITSTGSKIAQNVNDVIEGVKMGRGTVGKLMTDDSLYRTVGNAVKEGEETVKNMQQTSGDMKDIVADVKSSNITDDAQHIIENVRDITEQGKEAIAKLQPSNPGEEDMASSLRMTLTNANEAMSDFSENTEALKHNWFFRGFFKRRGFFDLDSISVDQYQSGRFAADKVRRREWLDRVGLFVTKPDGSEGFAEQGKKKVDTAMASFLRYAKTNPIIVEGYASGGTPDEQFLKSLTRASQVRDYLVRRFDLKPNYVGVMPMGAVKSSEPSGKLWDGVALVLFLPKEKK